MLQVEQFRRYVVEPTLNYMGQGFSKPGAVELIIGTALVESNLQCLHQIGGPASGLLQMEPATHDDIWTNYLKFREELAEKVYDLMTCQPAREQLHTNLSYQVAMARLHYWRAASTPIPSDIHGLARYWKKHYNTNKGRGKFEDFVSAYERYAK